MLGSWLENTSFIHIMSFNDPFFIGFFQTSLEQFGDSNILFRTREHMQTSLIINYILHSFIDFGLIFQKIDFIAHDDQ